MLAKNILILSLIHVVRLILPLLVIPILTRRITPDDFGIYMYVISFSAWLSIFVEYGFNISSTREIAEKKDIREIFAVVAGTQSAKILLLLTSIPFLVFAMFFVPIFEGYWYWAVTAWLLGVLTAFLPIYYFQGRENLKLVGITEIFCGLLMLGAVYVFIHDSSELYRLAIIVVLSRLISLSLLSWKMYADDDIRGVNLFNFHDGILHLKNGFNLFIFQGAVSLYTSFNVVLLGFYCSPAQVGAYAFAERLMRAGIGFLGQFSNAIFPRLNALKEKFPEKMEKLRLKVLISFFILGIVGMLATWEISPYIVKYMFAGEIDRANKILWILGFIVPAISISNVLGYQYLLVDRQEKLFNIIIFCAAIINVVMAYFLIRYYEAEGMAISWVLIEWVIAVAIAFAVFVLARKKKSITTD